MIDRHYLLGRKEIKTDATEITRDNLIDELSQALATHRENRIAIQYLWDYYRGKQPIWYKEKKVRPEINSKVVVNKANEIVSFKTGYLVGEPIVYVSTSDEEKVMENVNTLNDAMFTLGKSAQDKKLVKWNTICGISYRYISTEKQDGIPFTMYVPDPRDTFVVKSSNITRKPMFAVSYYQKEGNVVSVPMAGPNIYSMEVYEVYTKDRYFKVEDGKIVEERENYLGYIPIIEYPANDERQGAFEIVLDLLDMMNQIFSDRMDGIDQFVQSFLKFVNCDIDEDGLKLFKEQGAIKIISEPGMNADVDLITSELNQDQTETTVTSVERLINAICGLPTRSGNMGSSSDTGRASELRDGWVNSEVKAKDSETIFKESEKEALRVILTICKANNYCDLDVANIDPHFTRRNYDNIQSKAQVLIALLQNNKVHPKQAYTASGLFTDPESAYKMGMDYYEEVKQEMQDQMIATANASQPNNEQGSSQNAQFKKEKQISNPIVKSSSETH